MNKLPTNTPFLPKSTMTKVVYAAVAIVLLMIGLAGLVIPVIPGVLFLLGAVLLMARVSRRVHHWSEGQNWIRAARIRMIQLRGLDPLSRVKFALLVSAQSVLNGIDQSVRFAGRLFNRFKARR